MSIDSLEKTESDPNVHGYNVEVGREVAVENGSTKGSDTEDHDFSGVSIFRSETERCRVFVMNFVNVLV